ncbi:MAG: hypothetical protein AAB375_02880 [Patescibacteria group bacterium]
MRYPISILAFTLLMPLTALAAVEPSLTMQSAMQSVTVGQLITVTVDINANDRTVSAATLEVRYPADKLEGVSIDKGSFFSSGLGTATIDNVVGRMNFSAGSNPARAGTGMAFTLVFRGKAAGSAPLTFGVPTAIAITENTNATVLGATSPVTLSVVTAGAATLTPTPYYSYTPTPSPTSIGGVAQVQTGPGETTILALIVGSIVALLYVGYAGSDAFRRNEAKSYSDEAHKNPPDFRS